MTVGKIFGVFVFSGLVTGSALAGTISNNPVKSTQVADNKGDQALPKRASASVVQSVRPQAPIVMGRSVSMHHKTKLHHVRVKPLDADDIPADGSL